MRTVLMFAVLRVAGRCVRMLSFLGGNAGVGAAGVVIVMEIGRPFGRSGIGRATSVILLTVSLRSAGAASLDCNRGSDVETRVATTCATTAGGFA